MSVHTCLCCFSLKAMISEPSLQEDAPSQRHQSLKDWKIPERENAELCTFTSKPCADLRRGSDKIVVMDKGVVVEQGTHEDLGLGQGRYSKISEGHPSSIAENPFPLPPLSPSSLSLSLSLPLSLSLSLSVSLSLSLSLSSLSLSCLSLSCLSLSLSLSLSALSLSLCADPCLGVSCRKEHVVSKVPRSPVALIRGAAEEPEHLCRAGAEVRLLACAVSCPRKPQTLKP